MKNSRCEPPAERKLIGCPMIGKIARLVPHDKSRCPSTKAAPPHRAKQRKRASQAWRKSRARTLALHERTAVRKSPARNEAPRAWQRMLSGRRLDLLDPSPLDVEVADIAHGLARVARWNGQTEGAHIYSVAQHSLLV